MAKIKVFNMDGSAAKELELSASVFTVEYNEPLIHQAVVTRLANERQGTKSTLTMAEVRGGGKKPWRQKGTGQARQGSIRSPQWKGGGVIFAPKPRDFSKKMNVNAKRLALFSALSKKIADGEFAAVKGLKTTGKTKEMAEFLQKIKYEKSVLLVMHENDENILRAVQNLQSVTPILLEQLNTYDIVSNINILATLESVNKIEEAYANDRA